MITVRKFEILQDLPKCDTETRSEQMLLEKWCPQTCMMQSCYKSSICKNALSAKYNKAKHSKMRSASLLSTYCVPGTALSPRDTTANGDPALKEPTISWGKGDKGRSTNKQDGSISTVDIIEMGPPTFRMPGGP